MVEFIDIGKEETVDNGKAKFSCKQVEYQNGQNSGQYFQMFRYQKDREGKWQIKTDTNGRKMNLTVPLEMIGMFVDMVVSKAGLNADQEH